MSDGKIEVFNLNVHSIDLKSITDKMQKAFEKGLTFEDDIYDKDFMYLTAPYDGIIDMLDAVKAQGIKTAVLSNKDHSTAKKVSDQLFADGLIDLCMGARHGVPLKPEPDAVFEIMEHFGVSKDECLYIGDTATDIKTAKNAGLYSIGVLWGFRDEAELKSAGADVIISDPMKIAEIAKTK